MSEPARIKTSWVLVAISVMISLGLLALVWNQQPPEEEAPDPLEMIVDTSTPEAAAETFLDAWRRREHAVALAISVGRAHEEVARRQGADAQLDEGEAALRRSVWQAMAEDRLALTIRESRVLEPREEITERLQLGAIARGEFLGNAYEREMQFVTEKHGQEWRVEAVSFGEILSDPADLPLTGP